MDRSRPDSCSTLNARAKFKLEQARNSKQSSRKQKGGRSTGLLRRSYNSFEHVPLDSIPEALMPQAIPDKYKDLFQKRAFASLATLMPDGRPQVTPVWVDFDGDHVIFNSAQGRQKDKNVRRDPRVALALTDPENPYRYLEIRGRVVEITEEGAGEHIHKMAKKYLGVDKYPYGQPGEVRVLYKIKPEHTTVMG